jgi:hypothetical protein
VLPDPRLKLSACGRDLITVLAITATCVTKPAAAQHAVFGQWRVTRSICPAECALSRGEVESWRGRSATYDDSLARFAEHVCRRPRYVIGFWPASGVYGGRRLGDLGIGGDSAMVVEVQCPTQPQVGEDLRWDPPRSVCAIR